MAKAKKVKEEKIEKKQKVKKPVEFGEVAVKILAIFCSLLMIFSMGASLIYSLIK